MLFMINIFHDFYSFSGFESLPSYKPSVRVEYTRDFRGRIKLE